jgi:hypothetical protein
VTTAGLVLHWRDAAGRPRTRRLDDEVLIGRGDGAGVVLDHPSVSRRHARITRTATGWAVEDAGSSNGTFVDDRPVESRLPLVAGARVRLGRNGPTLAVEAAAVAALADPAATVLQPGSGPAAAPRRSDGEDLAARYFGEAEPEAMGERTRFVRRALRDERAAQAARLAGERRRGRRRVAGLVGVLVLVVAVAGGGGWLLHQRVQATRQLALELFYEMKALELEVLRTREQVDRLAADEAERERLAEHLARLSEMRDRYRAMVERTRVARFFTSDEDVLIERVAAAFGEAEIAIPPRFRREVKDYVDRWRATGRFARAIRRAERNGYTERVVAALEAEGLPPEFFYLGLQESNFDLRAVGPLTRWGYAKGPWQFIPATGREYGLRIGPLSGEPVYDPADERHDFARATAAAARFLGDLYRTDAHASGLLVMASYNWGPGNILARIRAMPANPRERNFWRLIEEHDIPDETWDYVFSIFSAAVIGENPAAFGFDVTPPLE